jgi:hypothetical protein
MSPTCCCCDPANHHERTGPGGILDRLPLMAPFDVRRAGEAHASTRVRGGLNVPKSTCVAAVDPAAQADREEVRP